MPSKTYTEAELTRLFRKQTKLQVAEGSMSRYEALKHAHMHASEGMHYAMMAYGLLLEANSADEYNTDYRALMTDAAFMALDKATDEFADATRITGEDN